MDEVRVSSWSSVEEHHNRQREREYGQHVSQIGRVAAVDAKFQKNFSLNAKNNNVQSESNSNETSNPNFAPFAIDKISQPINIVENDTVGNNVEQIDMPNGDASHCTKKKDSLRGKDNRPLNNEINRIISQPMQEDLFLNEIGNLTNGQNMCANTSQRTTAQNLTILNAMQNNQQLEQIADNAPQIVEATTQSDQREISNFFYSNDKTHSKHDIDEPSMSMPCDIMKLTSELEQERSKSTELERQLKNLSKICDNMDLHMKSTKGVEQHQSIESLEQALKLQVDKRMEAEAELTNLKKSSYVNKNHLEAGEPFTSPHSTMENFFKDVKNLIKQLKISSGECRKIDSIQEQLSDFDELLTAFLLETDGLDGDEEEKLMNRKDVIWFLNELKLRFIPIRERCEKDNQAMITFASQLAVLTQNTIAEQSRNREELPTAQLKAKELLIAKLEGKITQLKENFSLSHQNCEENTTIPNNLSMQDLWKAYNVLRKKHGHLESRHRSLSREMQDSIRNKEKVIISLKAALKRDDVDNTHKAHTSKNLESDSKITPFGNLNDESAQKEIDERNSLIDEMRVEIERLTLEKKVSVANEADKIRLRYLEGIVHELERKLAFSTGSSPGSIQYGSISLYDIDYSLNCINDGSPYEDVASSHIDEENLKSRINKLSDCLTQSEHKRINMEIDFKKKRDIYEQKISTVQRFLKNIKAPPEVLKSLQNI